jgi:eukaryotic-like serine/threonine-protein kinase
LNKSQSVAEIFNAAAEIRDLAARAEYLGRACAGDLELRREVDSLLAAHEQAAGFLEGNPTFLSAENIDRSPQEGEGTRIGRYKLLEKIGEGGFGDVWMAEQEQPMRRRVALKIIKLGMDTKEVIARFEAERQALALMDHPNIARVFDGGTTELGRPYFVMEYVAGEQITHFCNARQLGIEDRLKLFVQVCDAVQHAHQKGIIHRDLKPSNVLVALVDGKPHPKVIDFGIAKAVAQHLTEHTLVTRFQQVIGTPAYMSPEQSSFGQQDIDVRSDIYSLGVLLYELLTGVPPLTKSDFSDSSIIEICRVIQEKEAPKPSTKLKTLNPAEAQSAARWQLPSIDRLRDRLRGDLDAIVLTAIAKDRTRRYQSASALAQDIHFHLANLPITARAPGTIYRAGKFARRNRYALATFCAFLLVLAVGSVTSVRFGLQAVAAEKLATERLWSSLTTQARALTQARGVGQNLEALSAVREAARLKPSEELRNIALRAMSLPDLELLDESPLPAGMALGPISPGLNFSAVGESGGAVRILHTSNSLEAAYLPGEGYTAQNYQFTPDERLLAINYIQDGRPEVLKVWDWRKGLCVYSVKQQRNVPAFCLNTTGNKLFLQKQDRSLETHDLLSGTIVARVEGYDWINRCTPHPLESDKIIFLNEAKQDAEIFDLAAGKILQKIELAAKPTAFAFSPDGRYFTAPSYDGQTYIYSLAEGKLMHLLEGHLDVVVNAPFLADPRFVLSRSWDGSARLWDRLDESEVFRLPALSAYAGRERSEIALLSGGRTARYRFETSESVLQRFGSPAVKGSALLRVHPSGRLVALLVDEELQLWRTDRKEILARTSTGVNFDACFSADGKRLYENHSGGLFVREIKVDGDILEAGSPRPLGEIKGGYYLDLSADGTLVLASTGRTIYVLNTENVNVLFRRDAGDVRLTVAMHPEKRWIATGNIIGLGIQVWNLNNQAVERSFRFEERAFMPEFSSDGSYLLGGSREAYTLWETGTWVERFSIKRNQGGNVTGVQAFSPDSRLCALFYANDEIWLVRVPDGQRLAILREPSGYRVSSLAFDNSGTRLYSATYGGKWNIWNLAEMRSRLAAMNLDW